MPFNARALARLVMPALSCLIALGAAPAAHADSEGPFHDGAWAATVQGGEAGYRSARVTLADYGGTWQDTTPAARVKHRACAGKRFPITVQRMQLAEVEFMVWGSSVAPQCPDLRVLVKAEGDKLLVGTLGEDAPLRLQKR